jgi:porin
MIRLQERVNPRVRPALTVPCMALGVVLFAGSAAAQTAATGDPALANASVVAAVPASSSGVPQSTLTVQDWMKRSHMFGDWGGARTRMADRGMTMDASWTQFFQATPLQPPFGDRRDWNYGGKMDFKATQDFSKFGWTGVSATGHVEFRYGNTTLLAGGTLLPTNTALLFPDTDGQSIRVSSLYLTKMIGTSTVVQAGRFNMVDSYVKPFTGGEGLDKFQNLAFVLPPMLARTTPPVAEGVFFTTVRAAEPFVTVGLYESTDPGFFQNGATVMGAVNLPIKPFAAPGHYVVTGTVSSVVATSLDQSPWAFLPIYDGPVETAKNAWTLDATFDQYLWWNPTTNTGYGVFGSFGLTDGNPSFLDTFFHVGIGGNSPIPGRSQDNFGVGFYHAGVSNAFRDSVSDVVRLRNENGGEFFYNVAVTGWSKIAADAQFIDPFAVGSKTRWFFSIRWKLIF